MITTAKLAIKEIRAFLSDHIYQDIDMEEVYMIDKNIYDLVIHQGVIDIVDDYLDYLLTNLAPVLNTECCSVIRQSESSLKIIYPTYIDNAGIPKDFITLYFIKVLEKREAPTFRRLYMYNDGKTKKTSTYLNEIMYLTK